MFVQQVLRRIGNQGAVDNARAASTELARLRVEREAVETFLDRLHARSGLTAPAPVAATVEG